MVDGKARRGRPTGVRSVLTQGRIVAEAVAMVEEAGLAAVTMRGLGRRLGVDAMSLYHHVDNRDALLDQITEWVLGTLELPRATGVFRDDVHAMAQAFRRVALRYPHCAPLVLTRRLGSSSALGLTEAVLSVLRGAGFPPDRAVHTLRAVLAFVIGTLLREVAAGPGLSGDDPAGVERRLAELGASGLPHVVEAAPHLAVCEHGAEFGFGLDLLITAVELRSEQW